jgi:hypothetical protein
MTVMVLNLKLTITNPINIIKTWTKCDVFSTSTEVGHSTRTIMTDDLKGSKVATISAVLIKRGRMQSMVATWYSHISEQIQSPTARSENKWACFR